MNALSRRDWLKGALAGAAALTLAPVSRAFAAGLAGTEQNAWAIGGLSNFHAIYDDPLERDAFLPFLLHVYHLYPEQAFHALIRAKTEAHASDEAIYRAVQDRLDSIRPLLGELRYSLPALRRQKKMMLAETLQLLGPQTRIDGYLEIGTTGRYLSHLRRGLEIGGDRILLHDRKPGYGLIDIVERGQISPSARFVDMRDYAAIRPADIADGRLDLITNFIGFHHAPADRLDGFVRSLHRVLRPGGRMVVRDHAVDSPLMNHRVALAHDVFNLGLEVPWAVNQQEIRHFTSLAELREYLGARGFRGEPGELYQQGDPTRNALMVFTKE
ncbi:MAG: class I SAM-dependent methyltransferase [Fluviicoccus sp.]|uniref:class I SAM-dependent methyltransferase n=1 Tax=Fluviicoccus sp. TaxID=2003552 RepID=UPI0027167394|nr:class I SAM-dependent methyltransferase [Fluviicoccus sp.]MDO8332221.1 class I SAM-dependent methyltransferase [Fluviicoccus sp.]